MEISYKKAFCPEPDQESVIMLSQRSYMLPMTIPGQEYGCNILTQLKISAVGPEKVPELAADPNS